MTSFNHLPQWPVRWQVVSRSIAVSQVVMSHDMDQISEYFNLLEIRESWCYVLSQ